MHRVATNSRMRGREGAGKAAFSGDALLYGKFRRGCAVGSGAKPAVGKWIWIGRETSATSILEIEGKGWLCR